MSDAFTLLPWPRIRDLVLDMVTFGHREHSAHGLLEVDVTRALTLLEEYKLQAPGEVSFTAFLVHCLGQAVAEHPMVHAYRRGRRHLVLFDDVDVNTLLEKRKPDGRLVPVSYVVRGADRKSLAEVTVEMREAVRDDAYDDPAVRRRRQLLALPRVVRRVVWWWLRRNPVRRKHQWGTVGLSNAGAFVGRRPSWAIPISFVSCAVVVGGIADRVCWVDGRAQPRRILFLTVSVDHDIVDGAPGARFTETLAGLIESATGLDDAFLGQLTAPGAPSVSPVARRS